jgi:hypothetical protein
MSDYQSVHQEDVYQFSSLSIRMSISISLSRSISVPVYHSDIARSVSLSIRPLLSPLQSVNQFFFKSVKKPVSLSGCLLVYLTDSFLWEFGPG